MNKLKVNQSKRTSYLDGLFSIPNMSKVFYKFMKSVNTKDILTNAIHTERSELAYLPGHVDKGLDLESLSNIDEYAYLKDLDIVKYEPDTDIISEFYQNALEFGQSMLDLDSSIPIHRLSKKPLMSLDLEATGLNLSFLKEGGRTEKTQFITGVCIAYITEDRVEHSLYIPTLNTEQDGVDNYSYNKAMALIQDITDNFTVVYANANFDRETCSLNGVKINNIGGFFDIQVLIKQTSYMLRDYAKVGLKSLSELILDRPYPMTLSSMGSDYGYHNISYSDMWVYGSLDASNTLAIMVNMIDNNPELFKSLALHSIDAQAMDVTSVFNRRGYPIDIDLVQSKLMDLMKREITLSETFSTIMYKLGCDTELYITKTEAISRELIYVYIEQYTAFVKRKTNVDLDILNNEEHLGKFLKVMDEDFGMIVKRKVLKNGIEKLTHPMDKIHLNHISEYVEGIRWIESEVGELIFDLVSTLLAVSSISQNLNTSYIPMLRGTTIDDTGFYKLHVRLKFAGAVTTRFSNSGGKPTMMKIKLLKTKIKTELSIGEGVCGINAQGVPSDRYEPMKSRKVLNYKELSKDLSFKVSKIDLEAEEYFESKLLS